MEERREEGKNASKSTASHPVIHRMYLKMSVSLKNAFGRSGSNRQVYRQVVLSSAEWNKSGNKFSLC